MPHSVSKVNIPVTVVVGCTCSVTSVCVAGWEVVAAAADNLVDMVCCAATELSGVQEMVCAGDGLVEVY